MLPNSRPTLAISCMPTQMPRNGKPRVITASFSASTMLGRAARPAMQSANAPTPGSTMRSAFATTSASDVTTMSCPVPRSAATRASAFSAERRLPEP